MTRFLVGTYGKECSFYWWPQRRRGKFLTRPASNTVSKLRIAEFRTKTIRESISLLRRQFSRLDVWQGWLLIAGRPNGPCRITPTRFRRSVDSSRQDCWYSCRSDCVVSPCEVSSTVSRCLPAANVMQEADRDETSADTRRTVCDNIVLRCHVLSDAYHHSKNTMLTQTAYHQLHSILLQWSWWHKYQWCTSRS